MKVKKALRRRREVGRSIKILMLYDLIAFQGFVEREQIVHSMSCKWRK